MRTNRRGFTLIELLVVIAIIAILAAILFPVFTEAKRKGQYARCVGNLKQIGAAMQMYQDEWNGRYPYYLIGLNRTDLPLGKSKMLDRYTKNMAVFICPLDPTSGGTRRRYSQWAYATEFERTPGGPQNCSYLYWGSAYFQGKTQGWPSTTPPPAAGMTNWVDWVHSRVGSRLLLITCEWHIVDAGLAGTSSERDSRVPVMPSLRADGSVQPLRWDVTALGVQGWHYLEYGLYGK